MPFSASPKPEGDWQSSSPCSGQRHWGTSCTREGLNHIWGPGFYQRCWTDAEDYQRLTSWHEIHVFDFAEWFLLPFLTVVPKCCLFIYIKAYVLTSRTPLHISCILFWPCLPFLLAQTGPERVWEDLGSFQYCSSARLCEVWRQRLPPNPKATRWGHNASPLHTFLLCSPLRTWHTSHMFSSKFFEVCQTLDTAKIYKLGSG